jgi:hypothetical protein
VGACAEAVHAPGAGEKHFVDFSGPRPHLAGPKTGEEIAVNFFSGHCLVTFVRVSEASR